VSPLFSNEASQPGLIASIDTTTVYIPDYVVPLNTSTSWEWYHDFPFGVIQPGYSLVWQCSVAAHAIVVAAVWEAIEVDQLDWFW
jgi:hypothetical protein